MASKRCKYCDRIFEFNKNDIQSVPTGGMCGIIQNGMVIMTPTHKEYLLCPYCGKANNAISEESKAFLKAFVIFMAMLLIVGIILLSQFIKYESFMYRCNVCGSKYISEEKDMRNNDGFYINTGYCKHCNKRQQVHLYWTENYYKD